MEKIEDLKEIKLFIDACDEMLQSKFILVDKRIGDVLKSIAKTKQVYNLMATCLTGFNFDKEWKKATSAGKELVMPLDEQRQIAFVFCMLNGIDDKKININEILQKYFSSDDCISAYKLFCQKIILPFKVHVVDQLYDKYDEVVVNETKINSNTVNADIIKRLVFLIKDIKSYISGLKKIKNCAITKDETIFMLNHMIDICEMQKYESMPALIVGVKAAIGADKELKRRLIEIEEIIKGIN